MASMHIRRLTLLVLAFTLLVESVPLLQAAVPAQDMLSIVFDEPIDAFSARARSQDQPLWFSYRTQTGWTPWQSLPLDTEEPGDNESELFMFPLPQSEVRIRGVARREDVHPIVVSKEPVQPRFAAVVAAGKPAVLSRAEWGADDSYLFDGQSSSSSSEGDISKGDLGAVSDQPNQRLQDCQQAIQKYSDEFAIRTTIKKDASGRTYRWPLQYSKDVRLLVVHHTGLVVRDDPRPAVERVRALYKYHALSRSWGDIGYHYIIDEAGQIYEGRAGGSGVVGGHAYCNNIGTVGIALLGNFEIEQPSQAQAKSLQWLLRNLSQEYGIDPKRSVQFHGKSFDAPIVRHRDLLSTLCPGYYLTEAFSQIIANVRKGAVDAAVTFPLLPKTSSSSSSAPRSSASLAEGISFIGRTAVTINPGGMQRLSFAYTAGASGAYEGKRVAEVSISSPDIRLWVDDGVNRISVTKGILLPFDLPAYETLSIQLIVQAPVNAGSYTMDIGGLHFTIAVSGRRARTGEYVNPFTGNAALVVHPTLPKSTGILKRTAAARLEKRVAAKTSSVSSSTSVQSTSSSVSGKNIRVRLSATAAPTVTFTDAGKLNDLNIAAGTALEFRAKSGGCEAYAHGERLAAGSTLTARSLSSNTLWINAVRGAVRRYRGTVECRVINGSLVLINELSLEDYLDGLSEEPDTEPYEKQRAFAIAARTYAAYYLQSDQRKFADMPYDASDDPATFQAYAGVEYAGNNPRWVQAVTQTAGQVLTVGGQLIRPPYFSSDDGRTRSPLEVGWKNFPFADVFQSKDDPWCTGMSLAGHGVGMSGCGAKGQALEGRSAEQILQYYYSGARITQLQ